MAAFWLIFTGGHTTTSGAGMAFPDWPLSNGSLNPDGWLTNFFMLLEHGHRLTAVRGNRLVPRIDNDAIRTVGRNHPCSYKKR